MGKAKGKKDTKSEAPKCSCDDPFKCACGNRPPRPSKGHKWYPEDQIWAGKGHKQKGASGQTASVSKEATVTEKGKTKIEQWQRLPSQLLQEYCQRQKRPPAKFKNIERKGNAFKYRVIVPDTKDDDKDLFFIPSHSVQNEEQAKEEGALLALLHLTPKLPHERKLPEPYRTTWLNAVNSEKEKSDAKPKGKGGLTAKLGTENQTETVAKDASTSNENGAKASSALKLATSYTSNASKRQQQEEKRKLHNARIRRHEAIRMANQNHQVFMSAHIRQHIEKLLRGDTSFDLNDDDSENGDAVEEEPVGDDDYAKSYVEERLHHEGFTKRQAKTAYREFLVGNSDNPKYQILNDDEGVWDDIYEKCLQWLLVHLNEDQLPEGFDPREGTLDVVVPQKQNSTSLNVTPSDSTVGNSTEHIEFASKYGISVQEAKLIAEKANSENQSFLDVFWFLLEKVSGISNHVGTQVETVEDMKNIFNEELEALVAIYGSDFSVKSENGVTELKVALEDGSMSLDVQLQDGYPACRPTRLFVSGKWPSATRIGASLHIELLKFLVDQPTGEPMIFNINAHVQDLLHSDSLGEVTLFPNLGSSKPKLDKKTGFPAKENNKPFSEGKSAAHRNVIHRRPKERRKTFWSVHPQDTPPAVAFPDINISLSKVRKSLPAANSRDEFLKAMAIAETCGRVLLVTGETGSGKSTQLPAYLLENDPSGAKIVVAQPRRLAATGVASRVAEERGETRPGTQSVGYVVRGDSAICDRSRLVFCTTGVLLRQLQNEDALACITHIVVDEVHERGLDSDVLLGLLKQCLPSNPHLRVVLMSATLDTDRFSKYFDGKTPHVHIPGRTFPVTDFTLEDILSLTRYIPPKKKKKINKSNLNQHKSPKSTPWQDSEKLDEETEAQVIDTTNARNTGGGGAAGHSIPIEELVKRVDETNVDYDLIGRLVKYLIQNKDPKDDGSILIFLAGAPEINNALETIKHCTKGLPLLLLPLHGGLQPKEQNKVFLRPDKGFTKVILSTNVAETSVTIPDCTIVIDTAREKQSSFDPTNRMPLLVEQFASKASLKQRRGRAGRVRPGSCYKLISKKTLSVLKDHSEPEIRRVALDQTLLQLLFLGVESGAGSFMKTLLDPPSKESLDAASYSLRKLGAVEPADASNRLILTPLGVHLAGIPAPPMLGKLLVMGTVLGCREAALAMAAGMSVGRSIFLRVDNPKPGNKRNSETDETDVQELKQQCILDERASYCKLVGNSDHALLAAVFSKWKATPTDGGYRKQFCDRLGLSFNGMRDMSQLVDQLGSALIAAGFPSTAESDCNINSWRVVRACIVAALAPGHLVKVRRPAAKYTETSEGAKAKDGEAKELKFLMRTDRTSEDEKVESQEERVFIHPSSFNFSNVNYSCPFVVYNSLVRTSKPFLRDITECSAYALLLFGGPLEVQAADGVIVVDKWVTLAANARIGSLMGGLREKVDLLLTKKVTDPSFELATTTEMKLISKLIRTDGLGT